MLGCEYLLQSPIKETIYYAKETYNLLGLTAADSCCLDSLSQTHVAWTACRGLMLRREYLLQSPIKQTEFCAKDL